MPFKTTEQKNNYNKEYYQKNKDKFQKYYIPSNNVKNTYTTDHGDYCIQCKKWLTSNYLSKHQQTALHKKRVAELIKSSP